MGVFMTAHSFYHHPSQPELAKTNVLGIIFFILGVPNLYAWFSRTRQRSMPAPLNRYALLILLAGMFAGIVEFSVF